MIIARCSFSWTSADRSRKCEFSPGDVIEGLDPAHERSLVATNYALEAKDDQEQQSLQAQLAGLRYPPDDCPEMDLDLIDKPSAPVTPRDPGQGVPMPPRYPLTGKLSRLGELYVGSQLRKKGK